MSETKTPETETETQAPASHVPRSIRQVKDGKFFVVVEQPARGAELLRRMLSRISLVHLIGRYATLEDALEMVAVPGEAFMIAVEREDGSLRTLYYWKPVEGRREWNWVRNDCDCPGCRS
jgi:hypothetical protein